MRVEWVHPSWRDLVIDYLADEPAARARFLSGCGTHGALLALSSGGGNRGERELPLLTDDSDWDALTDRFYQLAPALDTPELLALLDSLRHAITVLDAGAAQLEADALARTVLTRVAKLWDESGPPIPLPALEAWLALARGLPHEPARPDPPDLRHTWAELLPATAPDLNDREAVERFADWLALADLLRQYRPDVLRRFHFRRDHVTTIDTFLDRIEDAQEPLHPACTDHVERSLTRIETVAPELASLARHISNQLRASQPQSERQTPHRKTDPLIGQAAGWKLFNVERVLRDL